MSVSLGGIPLSENLTLDIGPATAAVSQRRLIGGASCIQVDGSSGGRVMTLNSDKHLLRTQLLQIRALQATGATLALIHHLGTSAVVITDSSDFTPDQDRSDPDTDPLITVSGNLLMLEV